ncbi:MAG: leucine-rich repeat protein, partial [Anaerotignum sp.]|nr:leucine-rich repeat protein [Anaerotignum sp.]
SATIHYTNPNGECGTSLTWEFNPETGLLTISGTGSMNNYSSRTAPWYEYASQITSIIVEENVLSIGKYAFDGCSNTETVTLPSSLTLIDQYAFSGADSMTDVYYNGTKSQWEDISKKFGNTNLSGRIIHPIMAEGIGSEYLADIKADMSIQYLGNFDGTFAPDNITAMKGTDAPKLVFDVNSYKDDFNEDGAVFSFTVALENAKFITDENTPITEEEAASLFFITTSETNTTLAAATNEFVPVGYDGWKPMSGGSSDLDSHDLLLKVLISPDHTEIDYTVYAGADAPIGNGSKFGVSLQSMLTETAPGTEATVTVISTFSSYETLPYCQVLSETYELQSLRIREAAGSMNYLTDIPQTSFVAEVGAKTGSVAGSLFLAGYDADGRMVFLNSQTASSENTTYLFYVENAESNIEELKVFFTSQDDSREPLTESIPFGKS